MTALLITPEIEEEIKKLKERARAQIVSQEEMMAIAGRIEQDPFKHNIPYEEKAKAHGFRTKETLSIELPMGYSCHFSYEQQPVGLCRHLSVSLDKKGKVPHFIAMEMICKAFGFHWRRDYMGKTRVWLEEYEPGHHAINMVEIETLNPEMEKPQ